MCRGCSMVLRTRLDRELNNQKKRSGNPECFRSVAPPMGCCQRGRNPSDSCSYRPTDLRSANVPVHSLCAAPGRAGSFRACTKTFRQVLRTIYEPVSSKHRRCGGKDRRRRAFSTRWKRSGNPERFSYACLVIFLTHLPFFSAISARTTLAFIRNCTTSTAR